MEDDDKVSAAKVLAVVMDLKKDAEDERIERFAAIGSALINDKHAAFDALRDAALVAQGQVAAYARVANELAEAIRAGSLK